MSKLPSRPRRLRGALRLLALLLIAPVAFGADLFLVGAINEWVRLRRSIRP